MYAAQAVGDAASAAYLYPLAKATQVGHILRAAVHAARAAELGADSDPSVGNQRIESPRRFLESTGLRTSVAAMPGLDCEPSRHWVSLVGRVEALQSDPGG
jgi:hypothetical protein